MSFLAPWGLLLGLLSIPLVALYFLRIRRRRVRVPSLLLWHALQRSERLASPFQRFRRQLLLFVQLLLLLLLTLAFARPYLATDTAQFRSVVLVLDTSASMGATDIAPTRFGAAIQQAREILGGLGPADEALLLTAGPRTQVVVPFTREVAEVQAALSRLSVSEGEGSLRDGLQLAFSLAKSRPDVEVVVLSDGGGEDLSTLTTGGATVRFVRVGARAANSGIIALDLRRSPVSELDQQLFVTVQNYGRREAQGSVEVYLDSLLIGVRSELLPRNTAVSMVFEVPGGKDGVLRIALDVADDELSADNEAWAIVQRASDRRVLLAGGDALTVRALSADPRIELHRVGAGAVTRSVAEDYDAIVFDGAVPDGMDGLSYVVLGPGHGGPVQFGEVSAAPGVLGWKRTHPALRFVNWDGVTIARARRVTDLGGLAPLVDGTEGPLVLGGERAGGRVLVLAFDPLHSDLPLRVAWPVLLLNSVSWMTEDAAGGVASTQVAAGRTWIRRVPSEAKQARVSGPDGRVDAQLGEGLLRVPKTDRVGVYDAEVDGLTTLFVANLLSQRESNIAPRSSLGLPDSEQSSTALELAAGRRELWRPLLLLALGVLCLEWLLWNFRKVA